MQLTSHQFKARSREKLADANLQGALKKLQGNFVKGRADRVAELENFPAIRDAAARQTRLNAQLNAPYSAEDDVTHTLRVHATPYGLPNAMLEIRNDLIGSPEAEEAMAEALAPVLNMGLVEIQKQAKAS